MSDGTILGTFFPKVTGTKQMIVRLVDKRLQSMMESTCTYQRPIHVLFPPCSPFLTLKYVDVNLEQRCNAGKEFTFQLKLYDVFGNTVAQDSNETCPIVVEVPPSKAAVKQQIKEQVNTVKIDTSKDLTFAVTVCFQKAGRRKVTLFAGSHDSISSARDIYVMVHPSNPHHLNDLRFTTNDAIDESFSPDPKVVYRNQWSILEAKLVDYYGNVVRQEGNKYNIGLKLWDGIENETEIEYKDGKIQNGMLRLQAKINEAGRHNVLISLTRKDSPDQVLHLEEVQIQVEDPPLYLAGSKFHYPENGEAGSQIQIEILPYDVFGSPLNASSSIEYNLTGDILSYFLEDEEIKETMEFEIVTTELNVTIFASVVLKKASRRKLMISDNNGREKNPNTHSHCKKVLFILAILPVASNYVSGRR